jgi:hypothetical protein
MKKLNLLIVLNLIINYKINIEFKNNQDNVASSEIEKERLQS